MSAAGVTAFRGAPPSAAPAVTGRPLASARRRPRGPQDPVMAPAAARTVAMLALTAFGAVHWMLLLEPAAYGRAAAAVGVAAAVAGLLLLAGRTRGWRRLGLLGTATVGGGALALLAGGVSADQLRPANWSALASAIAGGVAALPGVRVPYRGLDDDLRLVIGIGGTLLAYAGALLSCWPRRAGAGTAGPPAQAGRPLPALFVLVALYAVPAVSLVLRAEFLRGAVLTVLVISFLRLDRVRRREAAGGLAAACAAATAALVLAPALDTPDPWWDYEDWAQSAAGARTTAFDWDHRYAALSWPRDGRELLRIKARRRAYWKADNLDVFDGRQWVRDRAAFGRDHSTVMLAGVELQRLRRWSFDLRVRVRNLRTQTLPLAGAPGGVVSPDRATQQIRPGVWSLGRPARRGDAYRAKAYVPQPSTGDLRRARTTYSFALLHYTSVDVIPTQGPSTGRPIRTWSDEFWGSDPVLPDLGDRPAAELIRASDLARTYRLAQRLRHQSATPYEYLRAIERHLSDGFRYSEMPPAGSATLDGFLFDTRIGFCQHYSGAMVLLLRLGGVPARVATGFAPGAYDRRAREYVVRDVDAHSWVEAFFPGIGWVTFDPTPAAAPPRSQALGGSATAASGDIRDVGTTQVGTITPPQEQRQLPWAAIALTVLAAAGTAVALRALWRRRGRPPLPAVGELERALLGAGHPVPPGLTLQRLESRYRSSPAVSGYVAALRAERYGQGGGGPTHAQRRGLRRALTRGRGPLVRLRTWWALRPRPRR